MQQYYSPQRFNGSVRKSRINWNKLGKITAYFFGAVLLFVIGVFLFFAKDLPSPEKLNNRFVVESTKIYDRTGQHLLYEVHGEEKRTQIPFSEMPETIKYATIALEDQNFYAHHGFQIKGIVRAILKDILHRGAAQGGSTITQQLIKKSMLTSEKTITRKIKEVILSIELEQKFEKDEILEMYLNTIPYGSNAYGTEAAAQTFFGKHAKELDLAEASLLASLPQAPSYYSPYGSHPEDLKARQESCLKKMLDLGYINQEQHDEAVSADILARINPFKENINAPHFVMFIKEYLEKKYGEQQIEEGGLKVYTTLDWDKQQAAEKAVREGADKNTKAYRASNAALVAIDPKTGQILAMVGSKDYFDKTIDGQVNVAVRERQPGSSFKPYVYLTAFQKGYTPETNLWDVDINFSTDDGKTYNPKNYDGKNRGLIQMKDALAMSLNVPAVETLYLAGVKNSVENAKKLGITSLTNPDRYGLSLVLGGGEVKLLDHASAFGTLATGGIRHDKVSILKIEDSKGEILEQYQPNSGEKVIDEKYVAMLDYVMSTNELRAPVFGENNPLRFDNRPVAAKTGTTNEWRDGWTVGYTPSLSVGVWAGNNDNSPMAQGADGIYVAAPIFRAFMDTALRNYTIEQFPKYEKEETGKDVLDGKLDMKKELEVCEIPGKDDEYCLANSACPKDDWDKKKFSDSHSILFYVDKDDPRGDKPSEPEKDPQFKNWEKAIKKWLDDEKGHSSDAAPTEACDAEDFDSEEPAINITTPSDGATATSSPVTITVTASSKNGIDKIKLSIEGDEVASKSDSTFSYSFDVPDSKKKSEISVKATVTDKNGNTASTSIKFHTSLP